MTVGTVVVAAVGVGAAADWGDVRAGLSEPDAWRPFAAAGVGPRAYALTRRIARHGGRLLVVTALVIAASVVAAAVAGAALDVLDVAVMILAGPGVAACGVAYTALRFDRVRSGAAGGETLLVIAGVASFVAAGAVWLAGVVAAVPVIVSGGLAAVPPATSSPADVAMIAASLLAIGVAGALVHRASAVEWADVTARADAIGRTASQRMMRRAPQDRVTQILGLEARRLVRSFEWRARPVAISVLSLVLASVILGVAGRFLPAGLVAQATASGVGATLVGGVCAGFAFVIHSTAAPLLSLDSDRTGIVLLRTVPHGLRALVAVRAMLGSILVAGASGVMIGILAALLPLDARAIGTAAVAGGAVAVIAPVLACGVSLVFPQPEWKEVAELGQRGWARTAATYAVGIAIAVSMTVASGFTWAPASAAWTVAALIVGAPLVAGTAGGLIATAAEATAGLRSRSHDDDEDEDEEDG